jgi:hypothetical protein
MRLLRCAVFESGGAVVRTGEHRPCVRSVLQPDHTGPTSTDGDITRCMCRDLQLVQNYPGSLAGAPKYLW